MARGRLQALPQHLEPLPAQRRSMASQLALVVEPLRLEAEEEPFVAAATSFLVVPPMLLEEPVLQQLLLSQSEAEEEQ